MCDFSIEATRRPSVGILQPGDLVSEAQAKLLGERALVQRGLRIVRLDSDNRFLVRSLIPAYTADISLMAASHRDKFPSMIFYRPDGRTLDWKVVTVLLACLPLATLSLICASPLIAAWLLGAFVEWRRSASHYEDNELDVAPALIDAEK